MFDVLEKQLLSDVENKLLSKVTDTTKLLNTFIKLVKAMKILDPTDVVVGVVVDRRLVGEDDPAEGRDAA